MTEKLRVIGIDPGPTPGLVRLHYRDGALVPRWSHALQCTNTCFLEVLDALLRNGAAEWPMTIIGVERFVTRGRTSRAQRQTGALADQVEQLGADLDVAVLQRPASRVKHWATDSRLKATGTPSLLDLTVGMRHARDAARHALFTAVHDGLVPDPLSKTQSKSSQSSNQQGARA